MSMIARMTEKFGAETMKRPPSRNELYEAFDVITEAIRNHKGRIDALEETKGIKPRYRVPATTRSI